MMIYSAQIREAVVRKAAMRAASQREIAREFGVAVTTVQNWLRQHRNGSEVAMAERAKRPQDWTAEERLQALIETAGLSAEALGSWCRGHGLHTHHLAQWRRELTAGRSGDKAAQGAVRALREENRTLKKALRRKEKALAETAALLVLKKKAEAIWGEREDD
jgi:transposase-like protein